MPRILAHVVVLSVVASATAQQPGAAPAAQKQDAILIVGEGTHRYEWVRGWGQLGGGKEIGNTHGGMAVDKKGRILVNTDTEHAVMFFSPEGKVLGSIGKEWKGGLHGMCLREEDGVEYLYMTHTGRHEALKCDLEGKVQWTLGWPQQAGIYAKEEEYRPTAIAVAPDGRIFVADGYGKSYVHVYDGKHNYVKSFGGKGDKPGLMQTPHGLWLDNRGDKPLLLVCDRENHRLQWFDMNGEFVREMATDLRRPCNVYPMGDGTLVVADLVGRVTILGKDDKPVVHLCDNPDPKKRASNGVPREQWRDGEFLSPHSVCVDQKGNLYVMDWNFLGRISKLAAIKD